MLSAERGISSEESSLVGKPLLNLKDIEKITINGEKVTLLSREEARVINLTKEQFIELGGDRWGDYLAPDEETVILFDRDGDKTLYTPGKQPKELTKYTTAQNFAQGLMSYLEAGALTYVIKQVDSVCNVAQPYCEGSVGSFVLNGAILEILRELANKELPFINYYKAEGNNKVLQGLLKVSASNAATYSLIIASAYVQANVQIKENAMQLISQIVASPALSIPVMGTVGYFSGKFVHWASRKAWEEWVPCRNPGETIVVNPDLTLLQLLGQFQLRWVHDVAITEAMLFYIATYGSQALAADPRFQMALLIGNDIFRLMANYFIFTPSPWKQITHERVMRHVESLSNEEDENRSTPAKLFCTRTAITVGASIGAFVVNEIALAIYPVNSFPARIARDAVALGTPLLVNYAAEKLIPKVKHWWSMFRRPAEESQPREMDETAILIPQPGT